MTIYSPLVLAVGYEPERSLPGLAAVIAPGRAQMDLSDLDPVRDVICTVHPGMIGHLASYAAVEQAESCRHGWPFAGPRAISAARTTPAIATVFSASDDALFPLTALERWATSAHDIGRFCHAGASG